MPCELKRLISFPKVAKLIEALEEYCSLTRPLVLVLIINSWLVFSYSGNIFTPTVPFDIIILCNRNSSY